MRTLFLLTLTLLYCTSTFAAIDAADFLQVTNIIASDGETNDYLGEAVAIYSDSLLVGAINDDDAGTDSGAVYQFTLNNETGLYEQKAKIVPPGPTDKFGYRIAIDGDVLVVGTKSGDIAYVFEFNHTSQQFEQKAELKAPISGNIKFGSSVAIDDNTIVIGAFHALNQLGAAYIYEKPDFGWNDTSSPIATLTSSSPVSLDLFGQSVAISGDTIIIGSHWDDEFVDSGGTAYIFVKPENGWADMTETAILHSSDIAEGDSFGSDVAISGDTIYVSANKKKYDGWTNGVAYVFQKPSTGWADMTQTAKLMPSDAGMDIRGSYFGNRIAANDDLLAVGAFYDRNPDRKFIIGSIYLFQKPKSGWTDMTENIKLTTSDQASHNLLGSSVAISGNMLVGGAPGHDTNGNYSGAVYIFKSTYSEGDVNGDGIVDLADTLSALLLVAGQQLTVTNLESDINNDQKIGIAEAVKTLQIKSGL